MGSGLQKISGTLQISNNDGVVWIDPLATLPIPEDDVGRLQTFPNRANQGTVHFTPTGDGQWHFETHLPSRFGDIGATEKGLFANGAWYPQPLIDGTLPTIQWDVTVRLSGSSVAALGDQVGSEIVHWTGLGERASLAVLPTGRITHLRGNGYDVRLLTRGPPRRGLAVSLGRQLPLISTDHREWTGAIVEAPLRRRLARSGCELAYVSDRAWRVIWILQRLHHLSTLRHLVTAWVPSSDPWEREMAAAVASRFHLASLSGMDGRAAARLTRVVPSVDSAISSGLVPFYGDLFDSPHPPDPVQDDLVERYAAHTHGAVVIAQLSDVYGEDRAHTLGQALLDGESLEHAAKTAEIPPEFFETWWPPYPVQDYRLEIQRASNQVSVTRDAPPHARAETIIVSLDGEHVSWSAGPGPDHTLLPLEPKHNTVVKLDPEHHVLQTQRRGDLQPSRFRVSLFGGLYLFTFNPFDVEGYVGAYLRRRGDTRNLWTTSLTKNTENLAAIGLGYSRYLGPPLTTNTHAHRLSVTLTPAMLDPNFAPLQGGRFAIGGLISYTFDNRIGIVWPMRGTRFRLAWSTGIVPENGLAWSSVTANWVGLLPLHPRHVVALRGLSGIANTSLNHRLLSLGGLGGIRGLPSDVGLAHWKGLANLEYRWAPLRHISVPHPLGWTTEFQLTAGAEAGLAVVDGELVSMYGATVGIAAATDVLGTLPTLFGVTLAWPIAVDGLDVDINGEPIVYLRAYQQF